MRRTLGEEHSPEKAKENITTPNGEEEEASEEETVEKGAKGRAHQYARTPDLEKKENAERAPSSNPNYTAPASELSLQTNNNDDNDITEGIEVLEDKEQHQASTSNIKRAFHTVASVLWPKSTTGHFLDKMKIKTRKP